MMSSKENYAAKIIKNNSAKIKAEALILVGTIVFVLFILEGFCRIFLQANNQAPIRADQPRYWYLPESSKDNRDASYPQIKGKDVFRIIVVGDSFTYGAKVQYDDTFPQRLERMLNLNDQQRKVEVLNWGIPGYSTAQEALLVKRAVKYYQADLVILQITLNDPELEPFHSTHAASYKRKQFIQNSALLKHWHSLGYLVRRIHMTMMQNEYVNYHKELFKNPKTYERFTSSLKNIANLCKENKVPLFVALFPFFSEPFDAKYAFSDAHKQVIGDLTTIGIPNIDLLPFYTGVPPDRLQVHPGEDAHPNEIAYRIAADAIYQAMLDNNLLPEDVKIKNISSKGRNLIKPLPKVDD